MIRDELILRIVSSILLLPLSLYFIINGSLIFIFLLIIIFTIASYEWHIMSKNKKYYYFGFIFLVFSLFTVYKLRVDFQNNYWPFMIVFLICILTDMGGYIFGKILKGPKLTIYSPNKTFAGLVGSYLFSICLVPFLIYIDQISENEKMITFFFCDYNINSKSTG